MKIGKDKMMIYENIATRFDITRSYVWPCVRRFLEGFTHSEREPLRLFEAGCGNGRNLLLATQFGFHVVKGMDICSQFVDICQQKKLDVVHGDIFGPMTEKYHILMSVAVIHLLDTEKKRVSAIRNLLNGLLPGGTLFFTVWSFEKGNSVAQKEFELGDNIVPWKSRRSKTILENRYYFIYNKDTLIQTLNTIGMPYELEWEEQNWIVKIVNQPESPVGSNTCVGFD